MDSAQGTTSHQRSFSRSSNARPSTQRREMLFVGIDWAEDHHDLVVMVENGRVLATARISDDLAGVGRLHALIADHQTGADDAVAVGIETDRGLLVTSLVAAGYEVFAVNPMVASRYRDRHSIAG